MREEMRNWKKLAMKTLNKLGIQCRTCLLWNTENPYNFFPMNRLATIEHGTVPWAASGETLPAEEGRCSVTTTTVNITRWMRDILTENAPLDTTGRPIRN